MPGKAATPPDDLVPPDELLVPDEWYPSDGLFPPGELFLPTDGRFAPGGSASGEDSERSGNEGDDPAWPPLDGPPEDDDGPWPTAPGSPPA
jgi:hypothetical protein